MLSLILVDDHPVVRKGLRALLEAEPDFRIVGEAADGLEALRLVEQEKPDVLIVDLMMPGLGGLDVTSQVRILSPKTRIVVLSMHADEAYVLEALRRGAIGYVVKDASDTALVSAVRIVSAGGCCISPPLPEGVIEGFFGKAEELGADS